MSYEGYGIQVCEYGCVTNFEPYNEGEDVCPNCGKKIVKAHYCSTTNCDDDELRENKAHEAELKNISKDILKNSKEARDFKISEVIKARDKYLASVTPEAVEKQLKYFQKKIDEINKLSETK